MIGAEVTIDLKNGIVIIASYHIQLSADIKRKNYKIKTSFVSPGLLF